MSTDGDGPRDEGGTDAPASRDWHKLRLDQKRSGYARVHGVEVVLLRAYNGNCLLKVRKLDEQEAAV